MAKLVLHCVVAFIAAVAACAGATTTTSFWHVTDIHVDSTRECSGGSGDLYGNFDSGAYGCGVSIEGLDASIAFMNATAHDADFIFFTGDAPWSDLTGAMSTIHMAVQRGFPSSMAVYYLLGNHDFPGAPVGTVATDWYKRMADLWGNALESSAKEQFAATGYYSTLMKRAKGDVPVRLVALNTEHFNHGKLLFLLGLILFFHGLIFFSNRQVTIML